LQGPGLKILTDLEAHFHKSLPVAMDAFVRGAELALRMIDFLSKNTGGFLGTIDRFFKRLQTPAGTRAWEHTFTHLEVLFKAVSTTAKLLFRDIRAIFRADAGTGLAIIRDINHLLQLFHAYATSKGGKSALHRMFEADKKEILAILNILPHLLSALGQIELMAAPEVTTFFTVLLNFLNLILNTPVIGQITALAVAFGLLASKLKLLALAQAAISVFKGEGALGAFLFPGNIGKYGKTAAAAGQAGTNIGAVAGSAAGLSFVGKFGRALGVLGAAAGALGLGYTLGTMFVNTKAGQATVGWLSNVAKDLLGISKTQQQINAFTAGFHPPPRGAGPAAYLQQAQFLIKMRYQTPSLVDFKAQTTLAQQYLTTAWEKLHPKLWASIGFRGRHEFTVAMQALFDAGITNMKTFGKNLNLTWGTVISDFNKSAKKTAGDAGTNAGKALTHNVGVEIQNWGKSSNFKSAVTDMQKWLTQQRNMMPLSQIAAGKMPPDKPPGGWDHFLMVHYGTPIANAYRNMRTALAQMTGPERAKLSTQLGLGSLVPFKMPKVTTGKWWTALLSMFSIPAAGAETIGKHAKPGLDAAAKAVGDQAKTSLTTHLKSAIPPTTFAKTLTPVGKNLMTGLHTGITDGFKNVGTWFKQLEPHIKSSFTGGQTWLTPVGKRIMDGLKTGVTDGFKTVQTWFSHLESNIKKSFTGGQTWLLSVGKNIIDGLDKGVTSAWKTVAAWFTKLPTTIKGYFSAAIGWLLPAGTAIVTGLINGLNSGNAKIQAWASSVKGIIMGAFAGAGGWLVGVGSQIASGLASGLSSGIAAAANSAAAAAAGIGARVATSARHSLGIKSPSTVMRDQVGKWITLGIAAGITGQSNAITAAINRLPYLHAAATGKLQVALPQVTVRGAGAAAAAAAGTGAVARTTPVIHIQNAVFNNAADLKKLMNRADFLIQHGRTAG
jgi:hypothetical protein